MLFPVGVSGRQYFYSFQKASGTNTTFGCSCLILLILSIAAAFGF